MFTIYPINTTIGNYIERSCLINGGYEPRVGNRTLEGRIRNKNRERHNLEERGQWVQKQKKDQINKEYTYTKHKTETFGHFRRQAEVTRFTSVATHR